MQWYFFFFLVSGFCSILYEVIWLRLAMAQYGVTTPLVSLVLSSFMLGLGLGSWGGGRLVKRWRGKLAFPALRLYALTELLIGVSALLVPVELTWGRELLDKIATNGLSSSGYYLAAGLWLAFCLVPWCTCMGATFPVAMFAIEERSSSESRRSFSYLYLGNVGGAVLGALLPLLLIEELGFHKTLQVSSSLNFLLAGTAFLLTVRARATPEPITASAPGTAAPSLANPDRNTLLWLLFGTGLTSMGAEVVWVRMFTPFLGTVVYAFAFILASYLGATYLGSLLYRSRRFRLELRSSLVWAILGLGVLLPLVAADPRLMLDRTLRILLGVVPFSGVLGFVTPLMVDRVSSGDGERAGRAYALNVIGCILGPLLAGFVLLPLFGERLSLCALALPWLAIGIVVQTSPLASNPARPRRGLGIVLATIAIILFVFTRSFETQFPHPWVRRDYTATVIATGDKQKRLLVNGVGMTILTPVTKMMAHLPLAMLDHKPSNMLIICFGMGTTHRSALSWGISSTVVELVPSVPRLFGYFHADGPSLLQSPRSHVVIDDGRLFLQRTSGQYDVIAIDPPPPAEAAGSSLLYSEEFYSLVKLHLRPGGILQQWLPEAEPMITSAVTKSLQRSFPYLRTFVSNPNLGTHFLASQSPIPNLTAEQMSSRLPATAAVDLVEWGPESKPEQQFAATLNQEIPPAKLVEQFPSAPALVDDRPVNEYFYGRHHFGMIRQLTAKLSISPSARH